MVLAARRPLLHDALLAAKAAGHTHVIVDGTLIETDRLAAPGPTKGVDLWWSGKHKRHGGNIQVVTAPDGWPLWTCEVRPGREHDLSAATADPDLLTLIAAWVDDGHHSLADLGYEGDGQTFTLPLKKPKDATLTPDQQAFNAVHSALRCLGERATPSRRLPTRRGADTAAGRPRPAPTTPPNDERVPQERRPGRGPAPPATTIRRPGVNAA